jgi:hypothetical protein
MGSIIKSVSLDFIEDSFLKDYNLSPTQLLKEKIWEMRGALKKLAQDRIQKMSKVIEEQYAQIEILENELAKKEKTQ